MLSYLRYGLATVCFTASIGCLTWREWNVARRESMDQVTISVNSISLNVETFSGVTVAWFEVCSPNCDLQFDSIRMSDVAQALFIEITSEQGQIGTFENVVYFPLWYSALIFALAGVAALRFGGRFTLRSAIIATAVVAGLLGIAVAL